MTSHGSSEPPQQHLDYLLTRDRERRVPRPTQRYGFSAYSEILAYAFTSALEIQMKEPLFYQDVVAGSASAKWKEAMREEMESLYKKKLGSWFPGPRIKSR